MFAKNKIAIGLAIFGIVVLVPSILTCFCIEKLYETPKYKSPENAFTSCPSDTELRTLFKNQRSNFFKLIEKLKKDKVDVIDSRGFSVEGKKYIDLRTFESGYPKNADISEKDFSLYLNLLKNCKAMRVSRVPAKKQENFTFEMFENDDYSCEKSIIFGCTKSYETVPDTGKVEVGKDGAVSAASLIEPGWFIRYFYTKSSLD